MHPEEQVETIANSIKQFGFNNPIIVDNNKVKCLNRDVKL